VDDSAPEDCATRGRPSQVCISIGTLQPQTAGHRTWRASASYVTAHRAEVPVSGWLLYDNQFVYTNASVHGPPIASARANQTRAKVKRVPAKPARPLRTRSPDRDQKTSGTRHAAGRLRYDRRVEETSPPSTSAPVRVQCQRRRYPQDGGVHTYKTNHASRSARRPRHFLGDGKTSVKAEPAGRYRQARRKTGWLMARLGRDAGSSGTTTRTGVRQRKRTSSRDCDYAMKKAGLYKRARLHRDDSATRVRIRDIYGTKRHG